MKSLLISIFLLATTAAFAQDPDKTVTLKASGSGTTQEQAKNNALRSAVEQAYGAFISSKTEILNDQVVADEIVSVASGNIQSFKILEEQHTDSLDFCLLEAVVSISKLTSFAQSKGYAVEVQGGMFAINIKQKQLNESAEVVAIRNGLTTALDILDNGFDFKIKSSEPAVNDAIKGDWKMVVDVETYTNENYVSAHKIVHSLLNSIGMNDQEVAEYKALGKAVYQLNYHFPDQTTKTYYLRTSDGLWAFIRFTYKIPNLSQRFKIQDGVKDYKNGVELAYENISKIDFAIDITRMLEQYTNTPNAINKNFSKASKYLNDIKQNKINPLKSNSDYWDKRNKLFKYDSYYEYLPVVCVQALDYFEIPLLKFSNSSLNFIYTLNEIERLNELKAVPLELNKLPVNKTLLQAIDISRDNYTRPITTPPIETRPFVFNEPLSAISPQDIPPFYIKQNTRGDRYVCSIIDNENGKSINNHYLTNFLEKKYQDLASDNFRKGLYAIVIDYIIETNGKVVIFNFPDAKLYPKINPSEFARSFGFDRLSFPFYEDNMMAFGKDYFTEKLSDVEGKSIANWILKSALEIENHPVEVSENNCTTPLKIRSFKQSTFYLYVN